MITNSNIERVEALCGATADLLERDALSDRQVKEIWTIATQLLQSYDNMIQSTNKKVNAL